MSQKISLHFTADGSLPASGKEDAVGHACEVVSRFLNYRFEKDKLHQLLSYGLQDAAITGDLFLYVYWDPKKENLHGFSGDFVTALLDGTQVFFGDVNNHSVEEQPYILIAGRDLVSRLREEARANGATPSQVERIRADRDYTDEAGDFGAKELEDTKASYVIRLYKENGTVWYRKSCRGTLISPPRDTGLKMYPVALMNWERVKNCYHGQAPATNLAENQLYINKAFAMVMKHMMDLSFSKVVYNANIIDEWTSRIGEAVAVNGPVENAAVRLEPGSMQAGFLDVIQMTMQITKELMGATDAALGNVSPDNTSAIIALQQSSAVPLEMQKSALYALVERLGMIWLDFMLHYYDEKRPLIFREKGQLFQEALPAGLKRAVFSCHAQAGASSQWSELAQVSTLDSLLTGGHIRFSQYLERLPDGYIAGRQELLEEARRAEESLVTEGLAAKAEII